MHSLDVLIYVGESIKEQGVTVLNL